MITVHNLSAGKPPGKGEYIGRPRTLGNPFHIGTDGVRAEVIAKYKRWLWAHIKSRQGPVYAKLMEYLQRHRAGETIQLLCHCKPLPCHGDVIKAAVEWLDKEGSVGSDRSDRSKSDNDGYVD